MPSKQSDLPVITILVVVQVILCSILIEAFRGSNSSSRRYSTCTSEIENANATIANWASTMRHLMAQSSRYNLTADNNVAILMKESARIGELIDGFGANLNRVPIERLVKDLVNIRRRSNRMALDVYLKTFDMRWPQASVQLGVAVERVQQACLSNLDRAAMMVLNSPLGALTRNMRATYTSAQG